MINKLISVVVPVKQINSNILDKIIPALKKQTYQNFELILVPDDVKKDFQLPDWVKIITSWPIIDPAKKRDLGVIKKSKGEILAFIDDDAYPEEDWLESALKVFEQNPQAAAVCGPGLTPDDDPLLAKVSGWVWSSWLGAGGAGTYRCQTQSLCLVDDYPAFNFLIKKEDFKKVGGFNSQFWPGEDTKLCQDIVYKLNKKIVYHPSIRVYHLRRKIFRSHLQQISRYGRQRGLFARKLPKTSNRICYWIPALFVIGLLVGPLFYFIYQPLFYLYLIILGIYLVLLCFTFWQVLLESKNILIAVLTLPAIFATHLFYGLNFLRGISSRDCSQKQ